MTGSSRQRTRCWSDNDVKLLTPVWSVSHTEVDTAANTQRELQCCMTQCCIIWRPACFKFWRTCYQAVVTGVTWSPILGSSDIVVGVIDVGNGTHSLYHIDPTVTFSAICTGIAKFVSYAFAMGTRLATINSVSLCLLLYGHVQFCKAMFTLYGHQFCRLLFTVLWSPSIL